MATNPLLAGKLLEILKSRNGLRTIVVLGDGQRLTVENVAWGRNFGDDYDHVTTNVSPHVSDLSADYFFTSEIRAILDARSNETLATS